MNILPFRIALAQINVTVGDLDGNAQKIWKAMQQAHEAGAQIAKNAKGWGHPECAES